MTRSEIEAIASSVARRLQPSSDYQSSRDEIEAIASALGRRLASPARPQSWEYVRDYGAARPLRFASRISARMASGIAARLASAVTKRLDERISKYVASAVTHRLGDEQLGYVASAIASKVASGRARSTRRTSELPAEDLSLDGKPAASTDRKR